MNIAQYIPIGGESEMSIVVKFVWVFLRTGLGIVKMHLIRKFLQIFNKGYPEGGVRNDPRC